MFWVFEGIDGAGKSTLIKSLANQIQLLYSQQQVLVLREPTTMPSGMKITKLLKSNAELDVQEWLDLFIADRHLNIKKNLEPAITAGKIILQDRYFYSTAAYQGCRLGQTDSLSPAQIIEYNVKQGFRKPDLLFFLKIDPDLAFARIQKNRPSQESFEKLEFLKQVAENYTEILPESTIYLDSHLEPDILCRQAMMYL